MKASKRERKLWKVREYKGEPWKDGNGLVHRTIEAKLLCNRRVVHSLTGADAMKTLQKYADDLNARKVPDPGRPIKCGMDGFQFKTELTEAQQLALGE